MKTIKYITGCLLVLGLLFPALGLVDMAQAAYPHTRDGWHLGLSYGICRGAIKDAAGGDHEYHDGAAPQIRFGRMISKRFMVGLEYTGWMYETGDVERKFRSSLQAIMLAATWYPTEGGLYVRGAAGYGWAGLARVLLDEDLHHSDSQRIDESGLGVQFALGYEFRIARTVSVGLGAAINHLNIGKDIYEEATYVPVTVQLGWYWD